MVGKPRTSENTSFGNEPPKFGNTAGTFPVVWPIDDAAQSIQGLSKSVREAAKLCVARTSTIGKPLAYKWALIASIALSILVPTTKRNCRTACARPGIAFAGFSIFPDDIASTSSVFQA